jgi:hypothetical protein
MFLRRLLFKVDEKPSLILSVIEKHKMDIKINEFSQWLREKGVDHRIFLTITSFQRFLFSETLDT